MSTIYYFCPDFPQPSGGIKTLYRHVWRLNQLGFDAAIVHQKHGFQADWHGYEVPICWVSDRPPFTPQDVWVFPEVMTDTVRKTSQFSGTRVVFALSWQPSYSRLKPGERWQDHGIEHVITKSPTIQRHLAWSMGCAPTLIPEYINPDLYHPNDSASLSICYTTRKDQSGSWLKGVLCRRGEPFTNFTWTPLSGMSEATYAQHLRSAQVYLATTMQEGMHVSILEAMACGALVVGYNGIGGADYMVGEGPQQNCILVENGHLLSLGYRLEELLNNLAKSTDWATGRCELSEELRLITQNGMTAAAQYQDVAAEETALVKFFGPLTGP